jgi:ABC-type molybdate transport system substrate-binding protein
MRKMVYAEDVKQVPLGVERKEVDAGFVYNLTDVQTEEYAKVRI